MNRAFLIAKRRARWVAEAASAHDKRTNILFCLDALRVGLLINDGKGLASPACASPSAHAFPSPIHQDGKDGVYG